MRAYCVSDAPLMSLAGGSASALSIFDLGLLLNGVDDNVPHFMRHDVVADDVFHPHPMRLPLGDRSIIVEFFGYGLQVQGVAALVDNADNEPLPLEIVELPFGRVCS